MCSIFAFVTIHTSKSKFTLKNTPDLYLSTPEDGKTAIVDQQHNYYDNKGKVIHLPSDTCVVVTLSCLDIDKLILGTVLKI